MNGSMILVREFLSTMILSPLMFNSYVTADSHRP